jgi:DNA polymerase-3 subunit beta
MDRPLLTIGAFARAVGLTPSALRHYDECGLLVPAEVDDATGYRYYTPDLARRAQAVARMREAGFPIEVMRTVLDGSVEERLRALQQVQEEQEALAELRTSVVADLVTEAAPADDDVVAVDGAMLSAAIRQVRSAADADPLSPLSGVLLDAADGTLDVVATNRYWMAVATQSVADTATVRAVLSLPTAARLSDVLDHHDRVVLRRDGLDLVVGRERFAVRDVAYPGHRILVAGLPPATTRVLVSRTDLLAAVETTGTAEVDLRVLPNGVVVGERIVPAVVDEAGLALRLGSSLLQRSLNSTLGSEVVLRFASDLQAVRIGSPHQPGFLALVMPVARATGER